LIRHKKNLFVSEFDDPKSAYGERVGMTFLGLTMQDLLIVLVFGEDKKKALTSMFESGSEQDVPARFYTRPEIAEKTVIITDLLV
jgi:6-phosphogluconolactonase/glucosamine-6-phosphate isomerase/deaminase